MTRSRSTIPIPLLAIALLTAGCSDSSGPEGSLDAHVRFVHAVRGTVGTVETRLEGGPSSQLPFGGFSDYQDATSGIRLAVMSDDDGTVNSGDVLLGAGTHHTIAYVGVQRSLARGLVLTDEPGTPGAGRTLVRAVHGSLQTGPVDLYLLEQGESVDGTPLIPGFDFLVLSGYEDMASGTVSLVLTEVSEPNSVRFDSGPLTVPSGSAWTLLVTEGTSAPTAINLVVLPDDD